MQLRKTLAANVRRIRGQRGFTQEELAHRAGISVRYLGSVERGETEASVAVIGRLARALRVKPSELLE